MIFPNYDKSDPILRRYQAIGIVLRGMLTRHPASFDNTEVDGHPSMCTFSLGQHLWKLLSLLKQFMPLDYHFSTEVYMFMN